MIARQLIAKQIRNFTTSAIRRSGHGDPGGYPGAVQLAVQYPQQIQAYSLFHHLLWQRISLTIHYSPSSNVEVNL
ncbi:hypothetical protein KQX54_016946 [Cotesia glomerata]|uniref:Uncharacterized protein n=1 Tax=Cotesia glomerata TaxID=32391 RepID=A0AAV7I8M2_COTGL|nr:hypothetical protein KQX54_016946 [Cotesia glomerata]